MSFWFYNNSVKFHERVVQLHDGQENQFQRVFITISDNLCLRPSQFATRHTGTLTCLLVDGERYTYCLLFL